VFFQGCEETMKRFAIALGPLLPGLLLAVFAVAARAEDAPPPRCAVGSTNILAQDKGDAKGDVTINCSGLTEAFGNQLTEVLNRILQDRLDPQTVLAKLSEVDRIPQEGVARAVDESQRHQIIQSLVGQPPAQIAITAHPAVDDSVEFAKGIATPLAMVGWQIEGNEIRRVAVKALDAVPGVAIAVRDKGAAPAKALALKTALAAAKITATLVSDPGMAPDAALLWIGRRPGFMSSDAAK
jgi:hypothetical protein